MAAVQTDKTFRFELVSPEKILASADVNMVTIPGEAGEFGVLANHAPLLSSIRPGVVTVLLPDGKEEKVFVAGGFADVTGEQCSVLAEEAVPLSRLNRAELEKELAGLKEDLGFAKDDAVKLASLNARLRVTEQKLAAIA